MGNEKQKLFLFRGLPGSGKSTAASTQEDWNHRVVEADMFFSLDGEYKRDPARLAEAHAWCLEKTKEFLTMGMDVSVANTFTRIWEMKPYLKIPNVKIIVVEMKTQYQNIHDVPDVNIERMRLRWEELPENFPWPIVRITEPLTI